MLNRIASLAALCAGPLGARAAPRSIPGATPTATWCCRTSALGQLPRCTSYAVPKADGVRATRSAVSVARATAYDDLISEHSKTHGVRADLVRAVMQVESGFNPYARSPKGRDGPDAADAGDGEQFGVRNSVQPGREHPRRRRLPARAARSLRQQRGTRARRLQRRAGRGGQARPDRPALPRDAELRRADQQDVAARRSPRCRARRSTRAPTSPPTAAPSPSTPTRSRLAATRPVPPPITSSLVGRTERFGRQPALRRARSPRRRAPPGSATAATDEAQQREPDDAAGDRAGQRRDHQHQPGRRRA